MCSIEANAALDVGCLKQKNSGLGFLETNGRYGAPVFVCSLQLSCLKVAMLSNMAQLALVKLYLRKLSLSPLILHQPLLAVWGVNTNDEDMAGQLW